MKALRYPIHILAISLAIWQPLAAQALDLADKPLFIASTEPRVMLLLSRDHELSKKAYTDYSDLTNDGVLDTTYTDTVNYYGYFDSKKCYTYSSGNSRFDPTSAASGTNSHDCSGAWSGNFLNWATMTRLDVVRKVLYGGFRSTDTASTAAVPGVTVLERAFLPPDVHAFAKVYAPAGGATDVAKYTPYSETAVTLCNVTDIGDGVQAGSISTVNGSNTSPAPLIKVARGSWPTWAMTEILQCQWDEQTVETSLRPSTATHRVTGTGDLTARVAACVPGMLEDKCKSYFTLASPPVETVKPIGLLQQYSDVDADRRVRFGLISGSYKKNSSGGVLRKNVKLLSNNAGTSLSSTSVCGDNNANDEVDVCTGQFINQEPSDNGIVDSLNRIHIAGYKTPAAGVITSTQVCITPSGSGYSGSAPFACNASNLLSGTNGTCVDWGNPLSEMYHEALRYFAGKTSASTAYSDMSAEDSDATAVIAGLGNDTWDSSSDPLPSTQWCALSNIIVLSTGLTSLDNATITSDISGLDPAALTNAVGTAEGIAGKAYLIGSNGTTSDNLCNSKTLSNLSSASGICPELPHMKGGYLIAGLANANRTLDLRPAYATNRATRWTGINSDWVARQPLGTYTVGLAENMPSFEVTVGSGKISLVPACRSGGSTICSMTDLRVERQTAKAGSFLVSWEDNSAGSDYDMDTISRIQYCVGPSAEGCNDGAVSTSQMKIMVSAVQSATGSVMELGYTVSGSSADGTVFPIRMGSTGSCNPNDATNTFSLLTSPFSSRPANAYLTWPSCPTTELAAQTAPYGTPAAPTMPSGIVTAGGCPSGSNCGCPKTATYTQTATPAGLLKNPLWYAAKYGAPATAWDLKNNVTGELTPDQEPDNFFDVRNPADLYDSLSEVFDKASQPEASASAVATNSTTVRTESRVYQAKFSAADWSGQLLQYTLNELTIPEWDTGSITTGKLKLNEQTPTSRVIITKGATSDGVPFRWSTTDLTAAQQNALNQNAAGTTDNLGSSRVDYLRGTEVTGFRARSSKLGDIVNSNPLYVGPPAAGYSDVDHPGYLAFRTGLLSRKPMVYVGANDGMLHGVNAALDFSTVAAGVPATDAGKEVLAYVPSMVFTNLSRLTDLKYYQPQNHRYFVDGSPMSADAYLNSTWKSVLVGGLGAGGRGFYALDITNPDNFTEANAASLLLWEFTQDNDADMGFAFNHPPSHNSGQAKQIVKMANGKWAAIVGNGYNSTSGKAALFILFIEDGIDGTWDTSEFVKIVVDTSGNGLSTPTPVDSDGDGLVDTVYAGDLKGNLWKFLVGPGAGTDSVADVVTASSTTWRPAFSTLDCSTATPMTCTPLFSATDGATPAVAQPITWPPEVALHPQGGKVVLFGTGKYLGEQDMNSIGIQTIYGIYDNDPLGEPVSGRSDLTPRTLGTQVVGTTTFRVSQPGCGTNPLPTCPATPKGWYANLPTSGERMTGIPKIADDKIVFNTFIPSEGACSSGGTGWLMSMDYLTGGQPITRVFDTNSDTQINSSDAIVAGIQIGAALAGSTLIRNTKPGELDVAVSSLASSKLQKDVVDLFGDEPSGRVSWREIIR